MSMVQKHRIVSVVAPITVMTSRISREITKPVAIYKADFKEMSVSAMALSPFWHLLRTNPR
jgi:hypothetical protein